MTEFNKSNWANAEFGQEYIDNADICIVERRRSHSIVRSFYKHFLKDKPQRRILDLGCGDGIITHELLKLGDYLSATLVEAKRLLSKCCRTSFSLELYAHCNTKVNSFKTSPRPSLPRRGIKR
jgi:2-polyprenyl-3-methyl-5-hydroxy-6-metoxy-1,4-benzoquinol methylase